MGSQMSVVCHLSSGVLSVYTVPTPLVYSHAHFVHLQEFLVSCLGVRCWVKMASKT